jgi:transposase-like protein
MTGKESRPQCPVCKIPMAKVTRRFTSPGRQIQRWGCHKCGRTAQTIIQEGK